MGLPVFSEPVHTPSGATGYKKVHIGCSNQRVSASLWVDCLWASYRDPRPGGQICGPICGRDAVKRSMRAFLAYVQPNHVYLKPMKDLPHDDVITILLELHFSLRCWLLTRISPGESISPHDQAHHRHVGPSKELIFLHGQSVELSPSEEVKQMQRHYFGKVINSKLSVAGLRYLMVQAQLDEKLIAMFTKLRGLRKVDKQLCLVAPGLFIGSIGAAQNLEGLRDAGITHILNASPLVPCFFKNYFQYLQINAHDDAEEDITQYFAHTNDFIEQGLQEGGVLIHCFAGVSRSAAFALAYMISNLNMDVTSGLSLLRCARPQVQPNSGFLLQLESYNNEVRIRAKRQEVFDYTETVRFPYLQ